MEDVARYCGLSTATVSRALRGFSNVSPETRALVTAAAAELNYVVSPAASSLASGKYQAVAVVKPFSANWYASSAVDGIVETLSDEGFDALLVNSDGNSSGRWWPLSSALRRRVGALVLLTSEFPADVLQELRSAELPSVVVGGSIEGIRSVAIDDVAATRLAVEHLIGLGHRRIGLVKLGTGSRQGAEAQIRANEYRRVLERHDISERLGDAVFGGDSVASAKRAAVTLLSRPEYPTAVFAASDEMAFGVILAAVELGLSVPSQISVVGIDDHPMSESFNLTTVRQNPRRQGAIAALHVVNQVRDGISRRQSRPALIKLVTRHSSAVPRDL